MKPSMLHKAIRVISYLLLIGFFCTLFSATYFLYSQSYSSFIHSILINIQRPDIEPALRTHYFPFKKFEQIKVLFLAMSFASIPLLIFLYKFQLHYIRFIENIINSIISYIKQVNVIFNSFGKSSKTMLFILLLFILVRSIYSANIFYIQYDEAWNYNLFLDKHIFNTIGAYNNYPLHNLISWAFVHVFGISTFVLRIPSILIGLLCTFYVAILVQYFLKREFISIAIAAIFSCLPVSVFYMMYARGVLYEIFFVLIVVSLLLFYAKNGFTYKRIFFLSLLNAFGTYSMLSHPYFIVVSSCALFIYGIFTAKKIISFSILYCMSSVLFSAILLIPMMLGTGLLPGISVLTGHETIHLIALLSYIQQVSFFITGFSYTLYVCLFLNPIIVIYSFKKSFSLFLLSIINIFILLVPILIPILTSSFPPERSMSFILIVPLSSMALLFSLLIQYKIGNLILYPFSILCVAVLSFNAHTHPFLNWSKALDKSVFDVAQLLNREKIRSIYNDCRDFDYYIPGIDYYSKQHHSHITFYSSSKKSTRYTSTIDSSIQCIILSKKEQSVAPSNMIKIYEEGDVIIFKRNKLP